MTDQELRDLVASTAKLQAETARNMAETDRRMAETDRKIEENARQMAESKIELDHRMAESKIELDHRMAESKVELDHRMARSKVERDHSVVELNRQIAETWKQIRQTDKQLKQTDRQLGKLGNKFGSFAEGMALPSMEKILRDRFDMDVVTPRATSRLNGRTIEIDVMAYDNGSRNELYIVEVKSHLTREGIDQILKTIEEFPKFFSAHRDRTVYGIIAAVDIPQNIRAEVLKQGLYLARIHDGGVRAFDAEEFQAPRFRFSARTKR